MAVTSIRAERAARQTEIRRLRQCLRQQITIFMRLLEELCAQMRLTFQYLRNDELAAEQYSDSFTQISWDIDEDEAVENLPTRNVGRLFRRHDNLRRNIAVLSSLIQEMLHDTTLPRSWVCPQLIAEYRRMLDLVSELRMHQSIIRAIKRQLSRGRWQS